MAVVESLTGGEADPVCVVSGPAGIGKTALAVRAATLLADRFPDATVYIDLHGHTDGHRPVGAAEALDRILRRLGVDGERIPADLDERAALHRALLSGRRILFVLDNAHDAVQVRPLLPGSPGCGAIVTSRRQLNALDEAHQVPLDVLTPGDAMALFRSVVGPHRLQGEPDGVLRRLVERCGRLPLAIRIAGARHRAGRTQTLVELEARLSDAHVVLAELTDGDRSVAASFQVSLADLPEATRRVFALLAAHPGTDIDLYAAAALSGEDLPASVGHLARLVDLHLLGEHAVRRYRMHDLMAVFARGYARTALSSGERADAVRRVVDYYVRAVDRADRLITPHRYRVVRPDDDDEFDLPDLPDYDAALDWLTHEQANLADACLAAGAAGFDVACWQLAHGLRGFYFLTKDHQQWIATHECALAAARRGGDVRAEAMTANNLGLALSERREYGVAAAHYKDALRLFTEVGDEHGEQTARANLAWLHFAEERHAEFLRAIAPVLAFYERTGGWRNAAIARRGIGLAEAALGRTERAVDHLTRAHAVFAELGLKLDIAMTLNGLGDAYRQGGSPDEAVAAYSAAAVASAACGSVYERARAHHRLGQLAVAAGQPDRARDHLLRALTGYRRLGVPRADEVEALLAAGVGHRPDEPATDRRSRTPRSVH
jgi:tetratricopeptide (TPR) repeat protein